MSTVKLLMHMDVHSFRNLLRQRQAVGSCGHSVTSSCRATDVRWKFGDILFLLTCPVLQSSQEQP